MKNNDCNDRLSYLQDEIARYQEAEARQNERDERERRERRREREESYLQAERQADDWPEALRKNAVLFRREVGEYEGDTDGEGNPAPSAFLEQSAVACERALEIWRVVEQEHAAEVTQLEAHLAELRDAIRLETARRLRQAAPLILEFSQTANALETMTPKSFLDW